MDILIVADNFSGAMEAAAVFAARGRNTMLSWAAERPECDVLAVDTVTRAKSAQEALFAVGAAVTGFEGVLYKFIDASLGGNPGAEIAAALRASQRDAVILPVRGQPAELATMFAAAGLRVSPVSLAEVRSGQVVRKRADVYLFEAETEEDLIQIGEATAGLNVVYAGSRGFLSHLPMLTGKVTKCPRIAVTKPVVTVIGNLSEAAEEQLRHVPNGTIPLALNSSTLQGTAREIMARAYEQSLRHGDVWLALLDRNEKFAEFVVEQALEIGGLIVAGGATTRAILSALGASSMEVLGEIEPGVYLGRANGLPVITKAGPLEDPDMLARLRKTFPSK